MKDQNKLIEQPKTYGDLFASIDRIVNHKDTPQSIKGALNNLSLSIETITRMRIEERAVKVAEERYSDFAKYKARAEAMEISQEYMEGILFKLIDKLKSEGAY